MSQKSWCWKGPQEIICTGKIEEVVQEDFEYLQEWTVCLLGHPVQVFHNLYSKKMFSYFQREFPVLNFMSIASCPATGHCWEEFGFAFSICCILTVRSSPSLLWPKQCCRTASTLQRYSSPLCLEVQLFFSFSNNCEVIMLMVWT